MAYVFGSRSLERLKGIHPDLRKVMDRTLSKTTRDITVLEGRRTLARQKQLLKQGATTTLNSRHITGHAVDLGVLVNGSVSWKWSLYADLAKAVKAAAKELKIPIEWGGDWKTFKDGPHFQLPKAQYPG